MPALPKGEPRVNESVYVPESISLRVRKLVSTSVRFSSISQFYSVAAEELLREVRQEDRRNAKRIA